MYSRLFGPTLACVLTSAVLLALSPGAASARASFDTIDSPAAGDQDAVSRWPDAGSDTAKVEGITLATVDWASRRAVAEGIAYTVPGARIESPAYWRAVNRARHLAVDNMELALQDIARARHHSLDSAALHASALRSAVVDRDFDPPSGKLIVSIAAPLFGSRGVLSSDAPAYGGSFNPYDRSHLDDGPINASVMLPDVPPVTVSEPDGYSNPPLVIDTPEPAPVRRSHRAGGRLESTPGGQEGPFTGVVIDCRGLGLLASMSPRINTSDGREVWGTVSVDHKYAEEVGIAGFMEDWNRALSYEPRVGTNPLILRAIGVAGGQRRSEAVLNDDDVSLLRQEDARSHFLGKFHVMFVVDPLEL